MELPRLKIGMEWEKKMPAYITERHTHILLLGKSGSGKSTCISNWWQQDNFYRNAKILIDPAGFLARDAYSISGGKYCSLETPISLNPMKSLSLLLFRIECGKGIRDEKNVIWLMEKDSAIVSLMMRVHIVVQSLQGIGKMVAKY